MPHSDTRLSKSSPVKYLESYLPQYSPECKNKWVVLEQGGELYGNPEVQNLFKWYQYEFFPIGSDSLSQNGLVELAHRTVFNGIKSCLIGAGLFITYSPFDFLRVLCNFLKMDKVLSLFICRPGRKQPQESPYFWLSSLGPYSRNSSKEVQG